jgi:hypothetical protein
MDQLFIAIFGVSAIWLSQDADIERRKYASILGLVGQPFWFYASYTTEQWGIFVLCFLYSWAWLKGFKLHWIDKAGDI